MKTLFFSFLAVYAILAVPNKSTAQSLGEGQFLVFELGDIFPAKFIFAYDIDNNEALLRGRRVRQPRMRNFESARPVVEPTATYTAGGELTSVQFTIPSPRVNLRGAILIKLQKMDSGVWEVLGSLQPYDISDWDRRLLGDHYGDKPEAKLVATVMTEEELRNIDFPNFTSTPCQIALK